MGRLCGPSGQIQALWSLCNLVGSVDGGRNSSSKLCLLHPSVNQVAQRLGVPAGQRKLSIAFSFPNKKSPVLELAI